jgi:integrase/recombinase XerD
VTHLRKDDAGGTPAPHYSHETVRAYIRIFRELSAYFRKPPGRLGPEHMRLFQAHLFRERKLNARTIVQYSAALRFFFVKTLRRHRMLENIPLPKEPRKLPTVLSRGEVTILIESPSNLMIGSLFAGDTKVIEI